MKNLSLNDIAEAVALILRQNVDGIPSEEDLSAAVDRQSAMMSVIGQVLSDDDREKIKAILTAKLVINMDTGVMIVDRDTYKPWLAHRKAEIDEYYWNRYKEYLLNDKHWVDNVVNALGRVGDEILDLLGNPAEQKTWKRKGLILGDIQSGKTSNYIALINKAADAGYKLIILLSGTLESLRKQTQERIDEGFVGLNSRNALNKDIDKKYVGVGKYDKRRTAFPLTDIISDFDVRKLQALNFSAKSLNEPIIFVVKKNTTVLKNLLAWISNSYKDTNSESIDAPLLLIDDEADNASVNTNKPELEPTAINRGIRSILGLFNRSMYVAVTATPFANIFINPEDYEEAHVDLFPGDFIYALSAPDDYIGNSAIFGNNTSLPDCIETIEDADGIFASESKSNHTVTALPVSLQRAINYFILCNVVRDLRGVKNDHRSMLVNINQYTLPQESTYDLIDIYLDRIQKEIKAYSKMPAPQALRNPAISLLSEVWQDYGLTAKTGKDFKDILSFLTESSLPIKVTMVNTKTKSRGLERLDYEPYKENGYRVIVIGGNSLSRGITLEGLCVSYFYRESKMYDTLLQMGRWFGYRPGYKDIVKVWISELTVEWFEFISRACEELRSEIDYMNKLGQTPREFGIKVLDHPDTLMITASTKMRTAKPMERWISLSGKLVETTWLTKKTAEYNLKLTVEFLKNVLNDKNHITAEPRLYTGIQSETVAEYIGNFASHPGNLIFNAREIGAYIKNNKNTLGNWFVYVANGSEKQDTDFAGLKVQRTKRRMPLIDGDCIRVSGNKSRVGSVGQVKIILDDAAQDDAYSEYVKELKKAGKYKDGGNITVPDHIYLRYAKKPILILYFMTCNEPKASNPADEAAYRELGGKTIVGLSLGFPRTTQGEKKMLYKINMVEQKNNLPFSADIDMEGDEDDEN